MRSLETVFVLLVYAAVTWLFLSAVNAAIIYLFHY